MSRPSLPSSLPSSPTSRNKKSVDLIDGAGLRTSDRRAAAVILAAAAGAFVPAEPVGTLVFDRLWLAASAGTVAYLASRTRRLPLYLAAALVITLASGRPAFLIAVAALGLAIVAGRHMERSAVFTRGLAGGLAMVSILWSSLGASPGRATLQLVAVIVVIASSALRYMPPSERRMVVRGLVGLTVASLVATAAAGVGMALSQNDVASAALGFEQGIATARAGDIDTAQGLLEQSATDIDRARTRLERLGFFGRMVPGTAQNVDAILTAFDDVRVVVDRGSRTASALDLDSLTLQQGRLDVGVLAGLRNPLHRLNDSLEAVIEGIDDRLPGPLLPPIRERLDDLRRIAADGQQETSLAAEAAEVLPGALGADGARRYLVLFTSPAEARGRFGFPGAYAEVVVDDGRLDVVDHGSVSQTFLDAATPDQSVFDPGDSHVRPYLSYGVTRSLLSVTIPMDFPAVATLAAGLWEANGREPVDGVLRFDPAALAALVAVTGPVTVDGVDGPLTADNVEEFLLRGQYLQFPDEQAPRREVLETVSDVVFDRLQNTDLPSPRVLGELFAPLVAEGHLNVFTFADATEAFLDRIGVGGALTAPTGDALLVTSVNSTGNKIDSFLRRSVTYTATDEAGQRSADLEIDLSNDAPGSGLPFYVIGSFLDPPPPLGTNRSTLLLHTAMPTEEVRVGGELVDVVQTREDGWWVAHVPVEIPPQSSVRVEARLVSDGSVDFDDTLRIEPGGGTEPDHYDVEIRHGAGSPTTFSGPVTTPTVVR